MFVSKFEVILKIFVYFNVKIKAKYVEIYMNMKYAMVSTLKEV